MPESEHCNKEVLTNILDSMNVGVVFVDDENRFAFVNKAGEEIRSISGEERVGNPIFSCHNEKIHKHVDKDLQSFRNGDYAHRHKMIRSKGRYFDNTYNVVKDDDGIYKGVVLVSQDITEKRELENKLKRVNEELEQKVKERTFEIKSAYEKLKIAQARLMHSEKMAGIGQFVSGLAHEINNPLDGVQNCIRTVISDSGNEVQTKEYLNLALEGLYKIEIMVRRLLDYAKPHNDEKIRININDLIEESLSLTQIRLKEKSILLKKSLSTNPICVYGDPHYLGQVLVNLILNAFDSMNSKGELTIISEIDKKGNAKIVIADTGEGIPEENLNKIFDPFFTTKQKSNGTGLGLYLGYNVISEMGGKIKVDSRVGEGSKFTIKLPTLDCEKQKLVKPIEIENSL